MMVLILIFNRKEFLEPFFIFSTRRKIKLMTQKYFKTLWRKKSFSRGSKGFTISSKNVILSYEKVGNEQKRKKNVNKKKWSQGTVGQVKKRNS